jgi:hypothetical protein
MLQVNAFTNFIVFFVSVLAYFIVGKPKLQVEMLNNTDTYLAYNKSCQLMLVIFFFLTILIQFFINSVAIFNTCGGNVGENMGIAAMTTFLPWTFFMGLMMIMLMMFPGWKSAFSDVIGYFSVAGSANNLLSELLIDTRINDQIDNIQDSIQSTEPGKTKKEVEEAATAIVKLLGNMSLLINQITPDNFISWWNTLQPLVKDQYKQNPTLLMTMKKKLLGLVVTRDNVGEAFWYIYTAILLISVVNLKIATQGCVLDPAQIQSDIDKVVSSQQKEEQSKQANTVTYNISQ